MDYASGAIAAIVLAFLLAGLVKGVVGMGLPTVAMGVLGLFMTPAQAAAVLIVPSFVTNVWQLWAGPHTAAVARRFATMMAAICVGTWVGIALFAHASKAATVTLGSVLALYGAIGLLSLRFHVPPRWEPWLSPPVGFVTGILTGTTGVFAIPAVPYFASLDLEKEALIQTLGLAFTVSTVALAIGLAASGHLGRSAGIASLLALAPAVLGMYAGQRLRLAMRPEMFRRWFFAALIPLGAFMALRGLV